MIANLIVAGVIAAATTAAATGNDYREYSLCLRSAVSIGPDESDMPVVAVMAKAIGNCAKEREDLLHKLIARHGGPEGEKADILVANQANRDLVEFEIERIRHCAEGAFILPTHSHKILFEEKLPDAPNN